MTTLSVDVDLLLPAFAAGLVVLATHVPLGRRVLARGIVFIDLAIAQIAALGVIAAGTLGWEGELAAQLAAVGAAVAGGLFLTWTDRRWPDIQEALIGVCFVLAASIALLLLAGNPHGGERLRDLLVGQILWVRPGQLLWALAAALAILLVWWRMSDRLGRAGFYVVFALAVTQSVQLVGVYLVFASLIVPALAIRHLTGWRAVATGWGLGAAGYALGLAASARIDLPSGATIVVALVAVCLLYGALGRRQATA